jgi:membrane fusion protein, protease secretion system
VPLNRRGLAVAEGIQAFELGQARAIRWGWTVVVGGVGLLLIWSLWAQLDGGVAMTGAVVSEGYRRPVQPTAAGKVAQVLVQEGSSVQAGQTLVRMDRTNAEAEFQSGRAQWAALAALAARLDAELSVGQTIASPSRPTWATNWPDASLQNALAAQQSLLSIRRNSLATDIRGLTETIQGFELQNTELRKSLLAKNEQLQLIDSQLALQRKLADEGYYPRNRIIELERIAAGLRGAVAEDIGVIARNEKSAAELRTRIESRRLELRKEAQAQQSDTMRDLLALNSKLTALSYELGNTDLLAPADGLVVGLAVHSPGSVVNAGAVLLEVVPSGGTLKVDALLPPQWIDKVRKGQAAEVQFTAFDLATTPKVSGVVETVSADALSDPKQQSTHYRVTVAVPSQSLKALQGFILKPGMPAEVFVRTGERSAMSYLLKPLQDRVSKTMTEP